MAMDGTSDGRKAHVDWESVRGNENECDAESRIRHSGGVRSRAWWDGWFERSDEWREEVRGEVQRSLTESSAEGATSTAGLDGS